MGKDRNQIDVLVIGAGKPGSVHLLQPVGKV